MCALQFNKTGAADTDKVALQDVIQLKGIQAYDIDNSEKRAFIYFQQENGTYEPFYFINDALDADDEEVIGDVWADGDDYVCTDINKKDIGKAFWFNAPVCEAGASITIAGQVKEAVSDPMPFPAVTFRMLANPYPMAIALNSGKFNISGVDAYDIDNSEKRAFVYVMKANGTYEPFYYINDALDGEDEEVVGDVWADGDDYYVEPTTTQIPAGQSFWVYSPVTAGSITITK